jgi:putative membrane protein
VPQGFPAATGNANLRVRDATFWHRSSDSLGIAGKNVKYLLIFLLVLVIFVISVTLGAHNDQVVNFNYLVAQGDYRVSTLLATLFGAGFVLGWIICGLFYLRTRIALGRAERKIKRLELQLEQPAEPAAQPVVSKE